MNLESVLSALVVSPTDESLWSVLADCHEERDTEEDRIIVSILRDNRDVADATKKAYLHSKLKREFANWYSKFTIRHREPHRKNHTRGYESHIRTVVNLQFHRWIVATTLPNGYTHNVELLLRGGYIVALTVDHDWLDRLRKFQNLWRTSPLIWVIGRHLYPATVYANTDDNDESPGSENFKNVFSTDEEINGQFRSGHLTRELFDHLKNGTPVLSPPEQLSEGYGKNYKERHYDSHVEAMAALDAATIAYIRREDRLG